MSKLTKKELTPDLHFSLLDSGKSLTMDAWGMSMYPFIKNGDRIKIISVQGEDISVGDIIAADIGKVGAGKLQIHRVVKITGQDERKIYFTKGDMNSGALDEFLSVEKIHGKVARVRRGNIKINLESPAWKKFNRIAGRLSLHHSKLFSFLLRSAALFIERSLFWSKVKTRLKKGNPLLYNTEELLLLSARPEWNEQLNAKAERLIKQGIHWEHFLFCVAKHKVTFLAYHALGKASLAIRIPPHVLDRLKSSYIFITVKTSSQHKELMNILKNFSEHDIPVLPLKGTTLARKLYGDIAARGVSVDFDFLIKEQDVSSARKMLEDKGYALSLSGEIKAWRWQYTFLKSKSAILDLHWDITMMVRSRRRIKGLWEGVAPAKEADISFYEFAPEELLLYLSAHLVNSSRLGELRYLSDINELLKKNSFNWDRVAGKARNWKLANSLFTALWLSGELLGAKVSPEAMEQLKPSWGKTIFIKCFANKKVFLRNCFRKRFMENLLSYVFLELVEASSGREYLSAFGRVFFPPREVLGRRSHASRIFRGTLRLAKRMKASKS